MDSTNHGLKIFGNKIPESSKQQNLNLPCAGNHLHSIYIVLGIISNLKMMSSIDEGHFPGHPVAETP